MKIFLFKNNDTGIEIRTTIKVFCPKGPKIEIVWDISNGLFKEKPIIFHGKPERIFPRNHSKNGSNNVVKISFSEIDFPNMQIKKKATPQKKDKKAALGYLPKLNSELMKIAKTGVIKKRNASRNVSRITKRINSL